MTGVEQRLMRWLSIATVLPLDSMGFFGKKMGHGPNLTSAHGDVKYSVLWSIPAPLRWRALR